MLYGEGAEIAFAERAREIRTEVHLLAAYQSELVEHERAREAAYQQVYPEQLARSLSVVSEACGPTVLAGIGEVCRFRNAAAWSPSPVLLRGPPRRVRATARDSRWIDHAKCPKVTVGRVGMSAP